MIKIDREKCINCWVCVAVCRDYVFGIQSDMPGNREVEVLNPQFCNACGHCISVCDHGAITHERLPAQEFKELPDVRISPDDMMNLIYSRRSVGNYKANPIPDEIAEKLVEAALYAGSASNNQDEEFIIIRDRNFLRQLESHVINILWNAGLKHLEKSGIREKLIKLKYGEGYVRKYKRYTGMIVKRRDNDDIEGMIFRKAPMVIITHGEKKDFFCHANCSIAIRNMEFLAQAMGLATTWAGFLIRAANKSKQIHKMLLLPETREIYGAIMVGYPKHRYKRRIPRRDRDIRWI